MEEDKHGRDAFRLREEMPTFARISHPQQNEVGPQKMCFCIHKAGFFQRFCENSAAKKTQFLPSAQKLKPVFVQKLKVGAFFM